MSLKYLITGALLLGGCALIPAGPGRPAVTTAATALDLERYAGRWHVLAAHRKRLDGDETALIVEYFQEPGGVIRERLSAGDPPQARGEIVWTPQPDEPARWLKKSWWPFSREELRILYVSPDYRYALAGAPDGKPVWILAREPRIPEWTYSGLVARLAGLGYDVTALRRMPPSP